MEPIQIIAPSPQGEVGAPVDKLIGEVIRQVENDKIVVIQVITGTSEGFYNSKTTDVIVVWKQDIRDVMLMVAETGMFRELPIATPEVLLEELTEKGYKVARIMIH